MLKMKFYRHLDSISRIAIPKEIRQEIELLEGDKVEVRLNENNEIVIKKVVIDE